ncbi:MAG: ABC transporter permease [Rhodospirillales bacterium]|nr:ABC transporter permease [Rhodospirillales bacterium]
MDGGVPNLKARLRRAERLTKLKYIGLIIPLALFLLVTFLWPIGSLLYRAVANPEVIEALPRTTQALRGWDGETLPGDDVFDAFAGDLDGNRRSPVLAGAAKRLNMEEPGFRSVLINTARKLDRQPGQSAKDAILAVEPRWGDVSAWRLVARNGQLVTPFYILSALDLRITDDGAIVRAPDDQAIYVEILLRTLWMSVVVTALCMLLGYPLAYLLAQVSTGTGNLLMILVLLPFWTSVLVRVAAWIVLLQKEGPINKAMLALGLITEPLQLVFNRFGVYIAMVHILLPFVVLPLYAVMKSIKPAYVRAAISLGAPPFSAFWKIYFPLSLPGVGAGGLLVFILCMGYYITPALLGSPREQMASYFVAFYTNETINWGMAAALSAVLLSATMILYVIYARHFGPARANQITPR